jgi:hypothetical protein
VPSLDHEASTGDRGWQQDVFTAFPDQPAPCFLPMKTIGHSLAVRSPGAQEGTARENARGASQAATTLIRPAFRERGFRRITISMSWSSAVNRFIRRSTENPASL